MKEKDALLKKINEILAKSQKERTEYITAEDKKHQLALDKIHQEHKAEHDLLKAQMEKDQKLAKEMQAKFDQELKKEKDLAKERERERDQRDRERDQ